MPFSGDDDNVSFSDSDSCSGSDEDDIYQNSTIKNDFIVPEEEKELEFESKFEVDSLYSF